MNIRPIFVNPDQYSFFLAPTIIRRLDKAIDSIDRKDFTIWETGQKGFYKWIFNVDRFTGDYVNIGKSLHEEIFKQFGHLSGNVLDVGGGWGLYRQWWDYKDSDVFVVHDPGIERIVAGPTTHYFEVYKEAFAKPVIFVDDFGENINYKNESFDCVILAEALDHIISPEIVLEKIFNVLKKEGELIIINHVEYGAKDLRKMIYYINRLKELGGLLEILKTIYHRIIFGDHHLRSFTIESLESLPESFGFVLKQSYFIEERNQLAMKLSKG